MSLVVGFVEAIRGKGQSRQVSISHVMQNPATLDIVEQWLKVGALTGGGIFFVWKLFTGWLIINLTLSIKVERAPKSSETDDLGITVTFEKGTTDSIWLKDVSTRVRWLGHDDPKPVDMSEELHWLGVHDNKIDWTQCVPAHGSIALSPGESTSIGRVVEIPANAAVTVEVAAYGRRNFWPRGFQWRASAVSLPDPSHRLAKS